MGGGDDLDEAFKWMCERAGGGDFVVLRASGDEDYNPYIQGLCKLNSVATLILKSREAAKDPFVANAIRHAEAVFIAGGDQAHYINWWMDTPVQQALNEAIDRGVPIGGTSAGLAVQGEFVYSAQGDAPDDKDLSSPQTLANPFHPRVTIVRAFLKKSAAEECDHRYAFCGARSHGPNTGVHGSHLAGWSGAEDSRILQWMSGRRCCWSRMGKRRWLERGMLIFLRSTQRPEVCKADTPLTFRGVAARSLGAGQHFDVGRWSSSDGTLIRWRWSVGWCGLRCLMAALIRSDSCENRSGAVVENFVRPVLSVKQHGVPRLRSAGASLRSG